MDGFGIGHVLLVVLLLIVGPGVIGYGLSLTAEEHAEKPDPGAEGYLGLWIAHHLPLRIARAWWVVLGLAWTIFLGIVLWRNAPLLDTRASQKPPAAASIR